MSQDVEEGQKILNPKSSQPDLMSRTHPIVSLEPLGTPSHHTQFSIASCGHSLCFRGRWGRKRKEIQKPNYSCQRWGTPGFNNMISSTPHKQQRRGQTLQLHTPLIWLRSWASLFSGGFGRGGINLATYRAKQVPLPSKGPGRGGKDLR